MLSLHCKAENIAENRSSSVIVTYRTAAKGDNATILPYFRPVPDNLPLHFIKISQKLNGILTKYNYVKLGSEDEEMKTETAQKNDLALVVSQSVKPQYLREGYDTPKENPSSEDYVVHPQYLKDSRVSERVDFADDYEKIVNLPSAKKEIQSTFNKAAIGIMKCASVLITLAGTGVSLYLGSEHTRGWALSNLVAGYFAIQGLDDLMYVFHKTRSEVTATAPVPLKPTFQAILSCKPLGKMQADGYNAPAPAA